MLNKNQQSVIGGIIGTAAMSFFMFVGQLIGMPKMNPAVMLSFMLGVPLFFGWLIHFMIGLIFAFTYSYLIIKLLKKINNNIIKGVLFGLIAFFIAQVALAILGAFFPMPSMEGNMMLMMIGSVIGHIIFGLIVAIVVKVNTVKKLFP